MKKKLSDNQIKILLGFMVYGAIFLAWHITRGAFISDDEFRATNPMSGSLFEMIVSYWNFNGRATLDALAEYFVQNYALWKIVDTLCFFVVAGVLCGIAEAKNYKQVFAVLGLVLLIPLSYFESAGYVSTTTNYLFTAATALFVGLEIAIIIRRSKGMNLGFALAIIGISYTMFHDQFIVVTILAELLSIIYMVINRRTQGEDKRGFIMLVVLEVLSILSYLATYLSPGHQNRSAMENTWLPGYESWTFGTKVLEGYTTTVANLIFQKVDLFILICLLLAYMGMKSDTMVKRLVGIGPLAIIAALRCLSLEKFIVIYEYACGLPDMVPMKNGLVYVGGFVASVLIVLLVFAGICMLVSNERYRFFAFGLMLIGAISREMMGFTFTVFASSYRTFFAFLFCMILAIILIMKDIVSKHGEESYIPMGIMILACFIL